MIKQDTFVVYTVAMANFLIQKGYPMLGAIDPQDGGNPFYKWYLFPNSEGLQKLAKEYTKMKRKKV